MFEDISRLEWLLIAIGLGVIMWLYNRLGKKKKKDDDKDEFR